MTHPKYTQRIEVAARELCLLRDIKPDERRMADSGYYYLAWEDVAEEIVAHLQLQLVIGRNRLTPNDVRF